MKENNMTKKYVITEAELDFLQHNIYTNFELRAAMLHAILTKVERCPSDATVQELRDSGHAVIIFTPEELRGAEPKRVQDELGEYGWDVIDTLSGDWL